MRRQLALIPDPDGELEPHTVTIGREGIAATRHAMAVAKAQADTGARNAARRTIAILCGGRQVRGQVWRFDDPVDGDRCKELLDTFDPGFTGAVVGPGLLVIAEVGARSIA